MHSWMRLMAQLMAHVSKKTIMLLSALAIILAGVTGGTIAWMMDTTAPVKNVFTFGNIDIALLETDTGLDLDNDPNTNTYQMMPGKMITKDPTVFVASMSENSWLFVKLEKSFNFDDYMLYSVADGWTELTEHPGIYYRAVDKTGELQSFSVLKDHQVKVRESVTKAMLEELSSTGVYPTLVVTAYAIQRDESIEAIGTAQAAWDSVIAQQQLDAVQIVDLNGTD